jgi:hypothetical protein
MKLDCRDTGRNTGKWVQVRDASSMAEFYFNYTLTPDSVTAELFLLASFILVMIIIIAVIAIILCALIYDTACIADCLATDDEYSVGKDSVGSHDLFEVLSLYFTGQTEKNNEKPWSEWPESTAFPYSNMFDDYDYYYYYYYYVIFLKSSCCTHVHFILFL